MAKRSKETITLGSGKIYLAEFTGEVPETAQLETEANLFAYIQGGAELSYEAEYHEASDDLGFVKKTKITKESATLKLGLLTWTGNTIEKLAPTARVTEDKAKGTRITKVGGAGNDNGKKYIARFLHEDKQDGNVRITIVGKNKAGFTLKFDKDNETVVDMEFGAQPGLDKEGTLIILEEEIDNQ